MVIIVIISLLDNNGKNKYNIGFDIELLNIYINFRIEIHEIN